MRTFDDDCPHPTEPAAHAGAYQNHEVMAMAYTVTRTRVKIRPWGPECSFTACAAGLPDINGVVRLAQPDDDLSGPISAAIARIEGEQAEAAVPAEETATVSAVDKELITTKEVLKIFGVTYLKTHPICTEAEYLDAFDTNFEPPDAAMARKLISIYMRGSREQGLTSAPTFAAFRDWVAATPIDVLMEI